MKVLFIGTHGQNNLGDELLLQVFVDKLGDDIDEWYINSYQPKQTKKQLKIKNAQTFHTRNNPVKLLGYLFQCDAIIFGGGSIIKELYPEYGSSIYTSLNLLTFLVLIGRKIFRKPIYL